MSASQRVDARRNRGAKIGKSIEGSGARYLQLRLQGYLDCLGFGDGKTCISRCNFQFLWNRRKSDGRREIEARDSQVGSPFEPSSR